MTDCVQTVHTIGKQFVQVSRPYEYCLDTHLRVSEYKIQYNVFCFPTEWESWIQDSRIFLDFAYVDVCDKRQLIFSKCLTDSNIIN